MNYSLPFLILIIIFCNSCKKKELEPITPLPPLILTPYHITANVDGNFIDAAFGRPFPDILYSSYNLSHFRVGRTDSLNAAYIYFEASDINLNQINYPYTIYPKNTTTNWGRLLVAYNDLKISIGYLASPYDSTLFSFTLNSFDSDTLIGTFQGRLFRPPSHIGEPSNYPDSEITITNGNFKMLMANLQ